MIGFVAWIASSAAMWACIARWPLVDDTLIRALAGGYASTSATMLGFVLAMLTVLISMSDRRLIRNMARTGHFLKLLRGLYGCAIYFGAALVVSLPLLILSGCYLHIGIAMCSGLIFSSALQLFVSGLKLWGILQLISQSHTGPLE